MTSKRTHPYLLQIATPHSMGSGFWLPQYGLILTSEHLVRASQMVVVGDGERSWMARVSYVHAGLDIALIETDQLDIDWPDMAIAGEDSTAVGSSVQAWGRIFEQERQQTTGTITANPHERFGSPFVSHSAYLPNSYSGGPLMNDRGELLGINTFMKVKGEAQAMALPMYAIVPYIEAYLQAGRREAQHCADCDTFVLSMQHQGSKCPSCGSYLKMIKDWRIYQPQGISKTLEDMLDELGYEARLCRRGVNHWQVRRGSASISITYHEKTGLIEADAFLVTIPEENRGLILQYLLRENYSLEGLTFSIHQNRVVLSLLIYDPYFSDDTALPLFSKLLQAADDYDDVLVDDYGASWR